MPSNVLRDTRQSGSLQSITEVALDWRIHMYNVAPFGLACFTHY